MSPWTDRPNAPPLAALLGAILVYANGFWGVFHFDDRLTILANPHLAGWETFVGHLDHMVRPVLYATLLLDRGLFGDEPAGYHVINLLVHLASGLLVYLIVARAATDERRLVPLGTALLFLLHPIQTEAVTYISGRASSLMAGWYLLALFLYLKATEECKGMWRSVGFHTAACASFLCALGSKETAATLPAALLLWEWTVARDRAHAGTGNRLACQLPYWGVLFAAGLWAWGHPRYGELARVSAELRPPVEQMLSALHAAWFSLVLLLCPWLQSFDHDLPTIRSVMQWPAPGDLALLVGFALAGVIALRRRRLLVFGMGWWALHMLPAHGLIPRVDLLSERNLYLPSMGAFLVMVLVMCDIARWVEGRGLRRTVVIETLRVSGVAIALACAGLTVQRNALYQEPVRLWTDAVRQSPAKARPRNNLGYAYAQAGDWERAIDEFRMAVQLDPHYVLAQENLRKAYLYQVGRSD